MNPQYASAVATWFTSRWHRGPKVRIAPTVRALPVPAPDDARGLYRSGEVHIVATQPPFSLIQTLAHEAVGHHGLRQLLGSEWKHFMRHISDGIRAGEPGLQQIRQHIRRTYIDDDGRYQLSRRQEADEIAAFVAEDMVCFMTGTIKPARPLAQALEAVKGRILREGLCLDRNVTRSELEGALFLATKHLEGWPWLPVWYRLRRFWRSCSTIQRMSKNDRYRQPMSWEESKRLLQKEEQRLKDKEERAFLFNGIFGSLCLIGLIVCAVLVLIGFGKIFFGH